MGLEGIALSTSLMYLNANTVLLNESFTFTILLLKLDIFKPFFSIPNPILANCKKVCSIELLDTLMLMLNFLNAPSIKSTKRLIPSPAFLITCSSVVKEFLKILSKSLVDCKTTFLNKSAVGIFSANSIFFFCWSRIFFCSSNRFLSSSNLLFIISFTTFIKLTPASIKFLKSVFVIPSSNNLYLLSSFNSSNSDLAFCKFICISFN